MKMKKMGIKPSGSKGYGKGNPKAVGAVSVGGQKMSGSVRPTKSKRMKY